MRARAAFLLITVLLLAEHAAAKGGNDSKQGEASAEPVTKPTAAPQLWALRPASDAAVLTPRPSSREFQRQSWEREHGDIFFIAPSTSSAWQTPHPGWQRSDAPGNAAEANIMELRWKLGAAHRSIPTLEVAGCDLISARDFYPAPRLMVADAASAGRLQRARQRLSNKISNFVRTGCE